MSGTEIVIAVVVGLVLVSFLQFAFKALGKLLRTLFSVATMAAIIFLLWKGGAFEWLEVNVL